MGSKKCFLYFYTTKQKALTLSNNFPLKFWRLYLESCLLHLGHKNISKISKSSWKRKFCLFSTNFCFIDTLCPTYKHNKTGFFFFSEFFLRSIRSKRLAANSCPWYPNCKDRFYLYISPEVFRCFLGEYEWGTSLIRQNDC